MANPQSRALSKSGLTAPPKANTSTYSGLARDTISRGHYESSNKYRSSTTRPQYQNTSEMHSMGGSVASHTDKGRTDTSARDYSHGNVIRVPHVVPSLDRKSEMSNRCVGYTKSTGPVVGKLRPAIVVSIYETSMICIPMSTSQGKGMYAAEADYCLWIRRWDDNHSKWNDIPEAKYLTLTPEWGCDNGSYINLTRAFSVDYQYPIVRRGNLTGESWERLRKDWTDVIDKGFLPLDQQQGFIADRMGRVGLDDNVQTVQKVENQKRADERDGFKTVTGRKK